MTSRRLWTGAVGLMLAVGVPVACTPPPGGTPAGPAARDVAVPMRDGVVLRADVWRPVDDGRHATLVYRTPYGKHGMTGDPLLLKAVERGYAVVVQDVRGRYASDGQFVAYHQEGADGYDTIEWAAAQAWSNGRVGTFGASYPGAVQWLAAVQSPPHLVAMVPEMTFASPTHFWYSGGVWDGSWLTWTWRNMAPDLRRRRGAAGPATTEEASAVWPTAGRAARDFRPRLELPDFKGLAEWYYEWLRHEPYDPWWDWAELSGKYGRVNAAVLNVSGWHDEMYGPIGAVTNFSGLVASRGGNSARARTHLVMGPWTHDADWSDPTIGALDMGAAARVDHDELVLRWMDRWLGDHDNGVDREPPARAFVMGANRWHTGRAWPPPAERRPLYLTGAATPARSAGTLTWMAPAGATTSTFVSDAGRPVVDPHDGEFGPLDYRALSGDAGVVVFETEPLADDLDVLGPLDGTVFVSVDAPDTDLWLKLLDVHPDGAAYNVMSAGLDVVRASYRHRRNGRELLQPGTVYRLDFPTLMTGNRFRRGHRLRVALMASFAPNLSWNLHTGQLESQSKATATARVTIHAGGEHASKLVVPVIRP